MIARARLAIITAVGLAVLVLAGVAVPRVVRELNCPPPTGGGDTSASAPPFARSGHLLVTNQSGSATLVRLATGAVTHIPVGTEPHGGAVSPDGRWGVVALYGRHVGDQFDGNTLVIIDLAAGRVVRRITTGEHRALHDIAFLPGSSDRVVVTAQRNRQAIEVDILKGEVIGVMDTRGEGSHSLALARDGRTLVTSNEESASISQLDLPARSFVKHIDVGARPYGIAVVSGGTEVWSAVEGQLRVFEVARGRLIDSVPDVELADDLTVSPNGEFVVAADWGCGLLHQVDVATRQVLSRIGPFGRTFALDIAPDNRTAFVTLGRRDRTVAVVDLKTGQIVARYPTQKTPDDVAWGPDPGAPE